MKKLYSMKDISELYGVSKSSINRIIKELEFEPIKEKNKFMYTEDQVETIKEKLNNKEPETKNASEPEETHQKNDSRNDSQNDSRNDSRYYERYIESLENRIQFQEEQIRKLYDLLQTQTEIASTSQKRLEMYEELQELEEPEKDDAEVLVDEILSEPEAVPEPEAPEKVSWWKKIFK